MQAYQKSHVVERDGTVTTDLDPKVRAILERLARCAYVADQHRLALVKISLEAAKLRGDLERMDATR